MLLRYYFFNKEGFYFSFCYHGTPGTISYLYKPLGLLEKKNFRIPVISFSGLAYKKEQVLQKPKSSVLY